MSTYTLESSVFIPQPLETVFSFFDKPENLEMLTPPILSFKILTPSPLQMAHGTCIDYIVKILGVPTRWTTLIQNYNPPNSFVDIQLKGPYSLWHHTHRFESVDGGTLVTDRVVYQLPFGLLGRLFHWPFIKPQLRYIFNYRLKKMVELFDADTKSSRMVFGIL